LASIVIFRRKVLVAKALLKALSQMPKQDYRILIHMLPEKLVVSCTHYSTGICLTCFSHQLQFG
jgi:hypothetical protein